SVTWYAPAGVSCGAIVITVPPRGPPLPLQVKLTFAAGLKPTPRLPAPGGEALALMELLPLCHAQDVSALVQILSCVSNGSLAALMLVGRSVSVRFLLVSDTVGFIDAVPTPAGDQVGPDNVAE